MTSLNRTVSTRRFSASNSNGRGVAPFIPMMSKHFVQRFDSMSTMTIQITTPAQNTPNENATPTESFSGEGMTIGKG
jgi:hypothetical protein